MTATNPAETERAHRKIVREYTFISRNCAHCLNRRSAGQYADIAALFCNSCVLKGNTTPRISTRSAKLLKAAA